MIAGKKTDKPIIIGYEILSKKSDGTISDSCTLEAEEIEILQTR